MATIDIELLTNIKEHAGDIFLFPEGELELIKFKAIKKQVEDAEQEIKKTLAEAGEKLNPYFTSIRGDKVNVLRPAYGPKYRIDESLVDQVPTGLITKQEKTTYKVEEKPLKIFINKMGGLPMGIELIQNRPTSISIALRKEKKPVGEAEDE